MLAAIWLGGVRETRAQISPGPLAKAHEELDSPTTCFKCHGPGATSMDNDCLDCHQGIRWLVQHDLGLHGVEAREDCASCHPDHGGRDFDVIGWGGAEPEDFDHGTTGWEIDGKHATLKCRDCHQKKYQTLPALKIFKSTKLDESWIGLERDCVSCHEDSHQGSLDLACEKCHSTRTWVPAPEFEHDDSRYPLTGAHVDVKCEECHEAPYLELPLDKNGQAIALYKPLPFAECTDCHEDPHKGALGPECASCHVVEAWEQIDQNDLNHDLTRYPLRGRHTTLKCEQCHDPVSAWGKKPVFATCEACHADPHAGKATLAGKKVDCATCHRVEDFVPSTYTVTQHQGSAYPLEGLHKTTDCKACHPKNPKGVAARDLGTAGIWLRPPHQRCLDCHEDDHGGQFANRPPDNAACEPCHNVENWKPSTYSVEQHARLEIPLDGRHHEVECAACHGPLRKELPALPPASVLGQAGVVLTPKESACKDCHADPHADGPIHQTGPPDNDACRTCHAFVAFRPSSVDIAAHQKLGYPLEGAHRAIVCVDCHADMKNETAGSTLIAAQNRPAPMPFTAEHDQCEDCHENVHGSQFVGRTDGDACEVCHGLETFEPATAFDHDRDSIFALEGAHADVYCKACHPTAISSEGQPEVIYRPLSVECASCHDDATSLQDLVR
jgi:hypothetical protein